MRTSESVIEISKALGKFQASVGNIPKTATNPHFKSKYAPLDAIVETINEHGPKHGLSHVQSVGSVDGAVSLCTRLMHTSGEWIESDTLVMPVEKATAQGSGSAVTYARRYQLPALYGLATDEDDDGHTATTNANAGDAIGDAPILKAIYGKGKALGMSAETVNAACKRDFGKDHPGDLTMTEAKQLADRMQAAIDKADEPA